MKRLNLLIGIATFSIGVAVVWFGLYFSNLPTKLAKTPERDVSSVAMPETLPKTLSGEVQFTFLSSEKRANYVFVKLQVENGSSEALSYEGYSKDWHCSYKIQRDKKIEQEERLCGCGNGLAERALLPGETATYEVGVLSKPNKNKVKVGFDFEIGQERRKETFWTDEVIITN